MCLGVPGQIVEFLDPTHHLAKAEISGVRTTAVHTTASPTATVAPTATATPIPAGLTNQNYRAHMPYMSLRFYFGGGATDR